MLKPHQYKYMGPNFSCTSEPSEKIFFKHSSPSLICGFAFQRFSYPWSTTVQNIKWTIKEINIHEF